MQESNAEEAACEEDGSTAYEHETLGSGAGSWGHVEKGLLFRHQTRLISFWACDVSSAPECLVPHLGIELLLVVLACAPQHFQMEGLVYVHNPVRVLLHLELHHSIPLRICQHLINNNESCSLLLPL